MLVTCSRRAQTRIVFYCRTARRASSIALENASLDSLSPDALRAGKVERQSTEAQRSNALRTRAKVKVPIIKGSKEFRNVLKELLKLPRTDENIRRFNEILAFATPSSEGTLDRKLSALLCQVAAHHNNAVTAKHILESAHKASATLLPAAYEHVVYQFAHSEQWTKVTLFVDLAKEHLGHLSARLLDWKTLACSKLNFYDQLRHATAWFSEEGLQPSRRTYTIMLRSSIANRDIPWARDVLEQMETSGFPFDASTYTAILSGHRAIGPSYNVEARSYAAFKALGLLEKPRVLNTLMQLRFDDHDVEGALRILKFFQSTSRAGSELDDMYRLPFLDTDDGDVPLEDAELFPPSPRLHASTSVSSSSTDLNVAENLFINTRSTPKHPDVISYTILISHCAQQRDVLRSLQLYSQMRSEGIEPNSHTISAVVRSLFTAEPPRWEDAVRIVAVSMYGSRSPPSQAFCTALGVDGVELPPPFEHEQVPMVTPTAQVFNALLSGLLQFESRSPDDVERGLIRMDSLLGLMKDVGIEPDAKTLHIFLVHLDSAARLMPRELLDVLLKTVTSAPLPSASAPSLAAAGESVHLPVQSSKSILNRYTTPERPVSSVKPVIHPHITHLNVVLRSILRREEHFVAKTGRKTLRNLYRIRKPDDLRRRAEDPFQDRFITSDATLNPTAGLVGQDEKGEPTVTASHRILVDLVRNLQARQVKSDGVAYDLRMKHDSLVSRHATRSLNAFRQMIDNGITPTIHHYTTLMKAYADRGDVQSARNIFRTAITAGGISATVVMFTILIVGYSKISRPDLAHEVFRDMTKAGVEPDAGAVDALARAYVYAGHHAEAKRVIWDNWEVAVKRRTQDAAAANETSHHFKDVSLKFLFHALRGLSGANRKGGKRAVTETRRAVTRQLVRRVLKTWTNDGSSKARAPRKPVLRSENPEIRQNGLGGS